MHATVDTPDTSRPETRQRTHDLRLRFGLILAIAMLPLLLFSVWQATVDYREDTRLRAEVVETSARLSVDGLMSTISDTFTKLEVLRQTVSGSACKTEFEAVLSAASEIDRLVMTNSSGAAVCTGATGLPLSAGTLANTLSPTVPTHIEIRRPDTPTGDAPAVLVLSLGDFQGDRLDRIFLAAINLSRLDDLAYRTQAEPGTADVAVLSRGGEMLYRSTDRFPSVLEDSFLDFTEGRRQLRLRDPDDRPRQVTVLSTDVPDLFTAVSEPERSILSWDALGDLSPALLPLLAWLFAFAAIWVATDRLILSHLRRLRGAALHFAGGDATARVGQLDDAPEQINQLGSTFDLLADRITEREASLQAIVDEKSVLLREIHHRVKNNLQIIISLLNMQQRELDEPKGRMAIEEARNRVGAIALVHRSLYESDDLSDVDVRPFLSQLVTDLHRSLEGDKRGVKLVQDVDAAEFDADMAIPIALFVVEAVSNAIKHGVPEGGLLEVAFHTVDLDGKPTRTLSITDSGPGPAEDMDTATGWRLMRGFARQVGGTFDTKHMKDGFEVRLTF